MKKFFAIAILAVASLTANAQAWMGKWQVGWCQVNNFMDYFPRTWLQH